MPFTVATLSPIEITMKTSLPVTRCLPFIVTILFSPSHSTFAPRFSATKRAGSIVRQFASAVRFEYYDKAALCAARAVGGNRRHNCNRSVDCNVSFIRWRTVKHYCHGVFRAYLEGAAEGVGSAACTFGNISERYCVCAVRNDEVLFCETRDRSAKVNYELILSDLPALALTSIFFTVTAASSASSRELKYFMFSSLQMLAATARPQARRTVLYNFSS